MSYMVTTLFAFSFGCSVHFECLYRLESLVLTSNFFEITL